MFCTFTLALSEVCVQYSSQRVFIVAGVTCNTRFSNDWLKKQRMYVQLGFILDETGWERQKIFKLAFGDNAKGERIVFSIQTWVILGRRLWAFRSSLHKSHGWKDGECSQTRQRTPTKYHFGEVAGKLDLSNGTCQWIPREDLNTRRISAKSVPRMLTSGNFRTI